MSFRMSTTTCGDLIFQKDDCGVPNRRRSLRYIVTNEVISHPDIGFIAGLDL